MKGNKYALGNNGGRPAFYQKPEELQIRVDEFFDYCLRNKEKATITGLCLFLGFSSRDSLLDYSKREKEFSDIIKRAKLTVEHSYEKAGQTIDIFALKQMGWKDKQEIGFTDNEGNNVNILFKPSQDEPLK